MRTRIVSQTSPRTAALFADAVAELDAHADKNASEGRIHTRGHSARAADYADYNARWVSRREREPQIDTID